MSSYCSIFAIKQEGSLRETGELKAGNVKVYFHTVQYGPDARQIDKPEQLLQKIQSNKCFDRKINIHREEVTWLL